MPLIPHLAEAAREAREDSGVQREAVAVAAERSADTVRLFEKGEQGKALDRIVDGYAEAIGVSPLDLWTAAIERAKKAEAKLKRGVGPTAPGDDARTATQEAERVEAEIETGLADATRQARTTGRRRAKSRRGSAKK